MKDSSKYNLLHILKVYLCGAAIAILIITCFYYFIRHTTIYVAFKEGLESCKVLILAYIINIVIYIFKKIKKES